jgi:hypothetical protein
MDLYSHASSIPNPDHELSPFLVNESLLKSTMYIEDRLTQCGVIRITLFDFLRAYLGLRVECFGIFGKVARPLNAERM